MTRWIAEGPAPVSMISLRLERSPGGIRETVARARKACRGLRDRMARQRTSWRNMAMAGLTGGDGLLLLLVRHPSIGRGEVAEVFRKLWPDVTLYNLGEASPDWAMPLRDVIEITQIRRCIEPLRVVVLAQQHPVAAGLNISPRPPLHRQIGPMPCLF
ncbi:hypothetical protein [Belnapia rosea]|nr:hypothetical protein [Belnapia rosea]